MRIFHLPAEEIAGLHHLLAGLMDGGGCVVDGAQDSVAVGHLSHEREVFANLDARGVGLGRPERTANVVGSVRFEIPSVELARAADEEEENAVYSLGRAGRQNIEASQRQAAERSDAEEIAALRSVLCSSFHMIERPLVERGVNRRRADIS